MPTNLTLKANEGSTYIITGVFKDAAGTNTELYNSTYSLLDENGNIVNSIEDEAFATSGGEYDFVFTGDDLYIGTQGKVRYLKTEGQYNSDEGNGLWLRDTAKFNIEDLKGVP